MPIIYWVYIGIMEKKMETTIVYRGYIGIMEGQMEKRRENEMNIGVIEGLYKDPSIQIIPTLGPKGCDYYLHWATWIPLALVRNIARSMLEI